MKQSIISAAAIVATFAIGIYTGGSIAKGNYDGIRRASIYTPTEIYHLGGAGRRVYTESGRYDITFANPAQAAHWLEQQTAKDCIPYNE